MNVLFGGEPQEHVYVAFRLGIMSKLKTKWLLSKTSPFILGFLFKKQESIR